MLCLFIVEYLRLYFVTFEFYFPPSLFLSIPGAIKSACLLYTSGSQAGAREMQALLNYQNYPVGTPDGLFGTGTETVLKAYQQARQLDADGICGEQTWQSLTLEEPFETEVLIDQNGDSTALCELGDSNDVVRQLQQRLATQYPLDITGTYDNATDQYVRAYQTANSITANGIVGPITWNKLFPILKMGRGTKDQVRALQMLLYRQKHGLLIDGVDVYKRQPQG